MNRREFLQTLGTSVAAFSASNLTPSIFPKAWAAAKPFELPKLPYPDNALAPYISSNTLGFHYGKHHAGYVTKLNELIKGTPLEGQPLEKIVKEQAATDTYHLFNQAAQNWNHTFYWNSLHPKGGGEPKGKVKDKLEASFGSYKEFRDAFVSTSTSIFGSGWNWLVYDEGKFKILQTKNADTPIAHGLKPILTIDVWEHAYYLDYQNKRKDYVEAVVDHLLNWEFAAENLSKA